MIYIVVTLLSVLSAVLLWSLLVVSARADEAAERLWRLRNHGERR